MRFKTKRQLKSWFMYSFLVSIGLCMPYVLCWSLIIGLFLGMINAIITNQRNILTELKKFNKWKNSH